MTLSSNRTMLLDSTINNVLGLMGDPSIFSMPVSLSADTSGVSVYRVKGPRAGAIELIAGKRTGEVLRKFRADDSALLRQAISWKYSEDRSPECYLTGSRIRMEAPWPSELQMTNITLDAATYHKDGRRFTTIVDEKGITVRIAFSDEVPHILIAGQTGSGKSVTLRTILVQLGQDVEGTRIIMIDGKYGDSLMPINGLPNQLGPIAIDLESARNALGWAVGEMIRRYRGESPMDYQIVIAIDEFQSFTDDYVFGWMFRTLGAKGRGAKIHILAATQYPSSDMYGKDKRSQSMKQHMVGRIVHAVSTPEASMLSVGSTFPRADKTLLGKGDTYLLPKPGYLYRGQMAFVPTTDIKNWVGSTEQAIFSDEWPEYNPGMLEGESSIQPSSPGRRMREDTGEELGAALWHQLSGMGGRDKLAEFIRDEFEVQIGAGPAGRMMTKVEGIIKKFRELGGEFVY